MKKLIIGITLIIIAGCFLPAKTIIPVQYATSKDWHPDSYWASPWGASGVHKGIDIFANKGRPVLASSNGIVLFNGKLKQGGNVIAVLGAKWRIHYYAHLEKQDVHFLEWVSQGEPIGLVGDTGNAKGKPAHLHYSILSFVPDVMNVTLEPQGWKKMFYRNPVHLFRK